jgi:hypothetical protein
MKPNRVGRNARKNSVQTQPRKTTESTAEKPVAENPDKQEEGIFLTLIDHDCVVVPNVELPPQLYAALQPFIQAAKAKELPQAVDLDARGGINFGLLNDRPDGSLASTIEISERVFDRFYEIEKKTGLKLYELVPQIIVTGLSAAESATGRWEALQSADNISIEMAVFSELVRRSLWKINEEGKLPPAEMSRLDMGLMLTAERLNISLADSLQAIRETLPPAIPAARPG